MAIAYVRDTGKITAADVNTSAGSFGSLPAVGNHVVVCVAGWNSAEFDLTQVTDNQSNTYTINVSQDDGTSGGAANQDSEASITSTKVATSSGTFTITIDPEDASGNYIAWVAAEFSGLNATTHLDRTGTGSGAETGDANVTASAANTGNDRLVVASCSVSSNDNNLNLTTPTTGYTALAVEQSSQDVIGFQASYKIISSAETSSATWTHDNAQQAGWAAVLATYIAAAGAAQDDPELRGRPFGLRGQRQIHQLLAG